jgi:hypothetical protein
MRLILSGILDRISIRGGVFVFQSHILYLLTNIFNKKYPYL